MFTPKLFVKNPRDLNVGNATFNKMTRQYNVELLEKKFKATGTGPAYLQHNKKLLGNSKDNNMKDVMLIKPKISTGYDYTYVIRGAEGSLVSAGDDNMYSVCGRGITNGKTLTPKVVKVPNNDKICEISQGISYHKLFLSKRGVLYGCGYNTNYCFGDGQRSHYLTLKELTWFRGKKIRKVVVSYLSSFVILKNGDLYVFGCNSHGKLGVGSGDIHYPKKVVIPGKVSSVSGGASHSCLCTERGQVYVAGHGSYGQCGTGTTANVKFWKKNTFFLDKKVKDVACGYGNYSFFLSGDSKVYGCGSNYCGVLGIGNKSNNKVLTPVLIPLPPNIIRIRCGNYHAAFMAKTGKIYMTGQGDNYVFGNSKSSLSNFYSPTLLNLSWVVGRAVDVFCGVCQTFVVLEKGDVFVCGSSSGGECLTGSTRSKSTFEKTMVTVRNEKEGVGDGLDYMSLIKEKIGVFSGKSGKKRKVLTMKFKDRKEELSISVVAASALSSSFSSIIRSGSTSVMMEGSEYNSMKHILKWNKHQILELKTSQEMITVFFAAMKWKITELVHQICQTLNKETDMKRIIDVLFELEEGGKNKNALFLAAKIVFKRNYHAVIVNNIGYLLQKKTENTISLYTYLLSKIASSDLDKLKSHSDFDTLQDEKEMRKKRSKLFEKSSKDFVIACEDSKFILVHREVISTNLYLRSLLRGSISKTLLKIDVSSKIMLFILVSIYKEKIDSIDLTQLNLQEVVDLKVASSTFGLDQLRKLCGVYIEEYDYHTISKEELSKSILNLHDQITLAVQKFKRLERKYHEESSPTFVETFSGSVDPFAQQ